jgi:hypothetical protein
MAGKLLHNEGNFDMMNVWMDRDFQPPPVEKAVHL